MARVRVTFKDGGFTDYGPNDPTNFYAKDVSNIVMAPEEPEEDNEKAMLAYEAMGEFLAENKNFLTSYRTDFTVWDKLLVFLNPGRPFAWVVRESGSFFFLLDTLSKSRGWEEAGFATMMYYFEKSTEPYACFIWNPEEKRLNQVSIEEGISTGLGILRKQRTREI